MRKIATISKKYRDKKWELYYKRVKLASDIRAFNFKITQKIRKAYYKILSRIKNRKRPDYFVLVKRIFIGFAGIGYGIKDAVNSWKFDRDTIDDYDIEIQSLSFHER